MKKFIISLIFIFSFSQVISAQGLDDLFEAEDFSSVLPEKVEAEPVSPVQPPVAAPQAVKAEPVKTEVPPVGMPPSRIPVPGPAVLPSAEQVKPVTATIEPSAEAGLLSRMSQTAPELPQIGSGAPSSKPSLGKNKKSNEEEPMSIFERRRKKAGTFQTDASNFDISGITLKMSPVEVTEIATANGFSIKFSDSKVPQFLQWKYKTECHKQNFRRYDEIKNCVHEMAQSKNEEYIERLVFEKPELKETITVSFTSNFGNNSAFRIRYVSKGNNSWGNTSEGTFLNRKRRQDFWRAVIQKYGNPDDADLMMWSNSEDGASLTADLTVTNLDASLVLEDMSLTDKDTENMRTQDLKDGAMSQFSF